MGLFKKKINDARARDFFIMAYGKALSQAEMQNNTGKLAKLKEMFPLLGDVKQEVFNEHLAAVNIAWLDIAWSKYCFPKGVDLLTISEVKRSVIPDIEKEHVGFGEWSSLPDAYADAFGSSYTDGNTVMAHMFVKNILGDTVFSQAEKHSSGDLRQVILGISSLFVGIYDVSMSTIKSHRLLS